MREKPVRSGWPSKPKSNDSSDNSDKSKNAKPGSGSPKKVVSEDNTQHTGHSNIKQPDTTPDTPPAPPAPAPPASCTTNTGSNKSARERQKEILTGSDDLTLDGDLRKNKLATGRGILQRWHLIQQNPLIDVVKFQDDGIASMIMYWCKSGVGQEHSLHKTTPSKRKSSV